MVDLGNHYYLSSLETQQVQLDHMAMITCLIGTYSVLWVFYPKDYNQRDYLDKTEVLAWFSNDTVG